MACGICPDQGSTVPPALAGGFYLLSHQEVQEGLALDLACCSHPGLPSVPSKAHWGAQGPSGWGAPRIATGRWALGVQSVVGPGRARLSLVQPEREARLYIPGCKRGSMSRPWQFIHANKGKCAPAHHSPQTHYTREQRQSAAASVGIMD